MRQSTEHKSNSKSKIIWLGMLLLAFLAIAGAAFWVSKSKPTILPASLEQDFDKYLNAQQGVAEINELRKYATEHNIRLTSALSLRYEYSDKATSDQNITEVYVPVTEIYSTLQDLPNPFSRQGSQMDFSKDYQGEYQNNKISFIPAGQLNNQQKMLSLDGKYYLDDFYEGAIFQKLIIEGQQADLFKDFRPKIDLLNAENVFSMHTTGVTALTRTMHKKLNSGKSAAFFSAKIGEFLSQADITHISNEVSFKKPCRSGAMRFCSDWRFLETLKNSGVDVVELTGNHNNDFGSLANTETIKTYQELGWSYVGGGLNNQDAAEPYTIEKDGTKFAMLAYNYPDAPNGGAISGPNSAGANAYSEQKMRKDIAKLRDEVDFIQVNVQFWECYAYPEGYLEFPKCDKPINNQKPVFRSIIDAGADMVVGSSAHQPQTYEKYQDKWIFYGLGNLYFDQINWPGTERGLILTSYYHQGKLLQVRITPTVYGKDFQTRKMTTKEADYLLKRLFDAR